MVKVYAEMNPIHLSLLTPDRYRSRGTLEYAVDATVSSFVPISIKEPSCYFRCRSPFLYQRPLARSHPHASHRFHYPLLQLAPLSM